jgi:hypothetical protein
MSVKSESSPSSLYRKQIENIVGCMRRIVSQTLLSPLRNMTKFTQVEEKFASMEDDAYRRCSDLDTAGSIEDEDKATSAAVDSMTELVHLKNDARHLIEKGPSAPGTQHKLNE